MGHIATSVLMIWMGVSSVIYGKPADKLRQLPTTTQGCPVSATQNSTLEPYFNMSSSEHLASWNGSLTDSMNLNSAQDDK